MSDIPIGAPPGTRAGALPRAAALPAAASGEIVLLTSMRGVAALSVVLYHFAGLLPALDMARATGLVGKAYLWVDFFFVLSGFILAHAYGARFRDGASPAAFARFMRARFARIYPLHLVLLGGFAAFEAAKLAALAWGAPAAPVAAPFTGTTDPLARLANLLMLQASGLLDALTWNGPAWSIGAEWLVYLAFPFMVPAVARLGAGGLAILAALCLAVLATLLDEWGRLDATFDGGALRCLCGFVLGMIGQALPGRLGLAPPRGSLAAGLAGLAIALALHFRLPDVAMPALFALAVPLFAAAGGPLRRLGGWRPLLFLGTVSYSLYLAHALLIEMLRFGSVFLTGRTFGSHFGAPASLAVLGLALALLVALSHLLFTRVEEPWRRRLR